MDSWVKIDKSRNKVTLNVFPTQRRVHTGSAIVSGSSLSERLHQEWPMDSLVTSAQLNRNGLMPVSLEGWETETSIHSYLVLQT